MNLLHCLASIYVHFCIIVSLCALQYFYLSLFFFSTMQWTIPYCMSDMRILNVPEFSSHYPRVSPGGVCMHAILDQYVWACSLDFGTFGTCTKVKVVGVGPVVRVPLYVVFSSAADLSAQTLQAT